MRQAQNHKYQGVNKSAKNSLILRVEEGNSMREVKAGEKRRHFHFVPI